MVIPSWVVASMSVACSIAHRAVFAAREPASARGSIWLRRAAMIPNSAKTKNAFTASRMTSHPMPHQSAAVIPPPPWSPVPRGAG